jgi:hypothetical protein
MLRHKRLASSYSRALLRDKSLASSWKVKFTILREMLRHKSLAIVAGTSNLLFLRALLRHKSLASSWNVKLIYYSREMLRHKSLASSYSRALLRDKSLASTCSWKVNFTILEKCSDTKALL